MKADTKGAQTDMRRALAEAGQSLSERQLLFVTYFLEGKSKSAAAEAAGYQSTTAMVAWRSPKVQGAIALLLERFLVGEAAPAALRALYQLVNDEKQAGSVRVAAANSLLDRAGFDSKRHARQAGDGKEASEMTREELQAKINELDARMRDVTPVSEPDDGPLSSQELDMYE